MNRVFSLVIAFCFLIQGNIFADEGMWLLSLIGQFNYPAMKKMGLKLTPEDIYSINKSSLKDAVVALDFGSCTAELISKDGLLLTNHHCGYDEIQNHSSLTNDYLSDGFWAASLKEELPNPGKTATFLVRIEDVSKRILSELNDNMSDEDRSTKIKEISDLIIEETTKDTHYEAQVKSFYQGNEFYLFVIETFKDIRLVGAPPESIGKFGHDTDNWMWPRQTGDFSMFRIYCGPDGKPAEYSENNVPYHPKHFLPISLKGVKKNDFTMILGYPGTTQRYLNSWGVTELLEDNNPVRIKVRGAKQDIMMEDMLANNKTRIQYSSKYAESSNYWKYSIGQNQGIKRLKVVEQKQKLEADLQKWIEADSARKEKYGQVLTMIKDSYQGRKTANRMYQNVYETFLYGPEIIMFAYDANTKLSVFEESPDDDEAVKKALDEFKESAKKYFKDYNPATDQRMMTKLFEMFAKDIPEEYQPEIFKEVGSKYDSSFVKFTAEMFQNSFLASEEKLMEFLNKPSFDEFYKKIGMLQMTYMTQMLNDFLKSSPDNAERNQTITDIVLNGATEFFKKYSAEEDKKLFLELLKKYSTKFPKDQLPDIYQKIRIEYDNDYQKFTDDLFSKSIFVDQNKFEAHLKAPKHDALLAKLNILQYALMANNVMDVLKNKQGNEKELSSALSQLHYGTLTFFSSFDNQIAKEHFIKNFKEMYDNASPDQLPSIYQTINSKYKGSVEAFATDMFANSIFANQNKMMEFAANPKIKTLEKDLAFTTANSVNDLVKANSIDTDLAYQFYESIVPFLKLKAIEEDLAYRTMVSVIRLYYKVKEESKEFDTKLEKGERMYIAALREMQKDKTFYPDANSSMRLTYGTVGDYEPRDAVSYNYYTTLEGVMEKEDPDNPEFVVSPRLKELYEKKDYGQYGENGQMKVCFTTNTDITGGNSGSPVMNGNGELVGIAFDGNWEAMSGDIAYEAKIQRTICVDIRYVLFVIDKYAGATRLINEMKLVK
jgi:hypothetical protein